MMTRDELIALARRTVPEIAKATRDQRPKLIEKLQSRVIDQLDNVNPPWTDETRHERSAFRERLVAIVAMRPRGEA